MSLYLCIFDGDVDVAGIDVGSYAAFNAFRSFIATNLENGKPGSVFPVLLLHSDSDGMWTLDECGQLQRELDRIAAYLPQQAPIPLAVKGAGEVGTTAQSRPTASETFSDCDGEPLLDRLIQLVNEALRRQLPILFQ